MDIFWEKAGWEDDDPHLSKLKSMPFYRPFPNLEIENGLYLIRGPRQVGKSTWLKKILSAELAKGRKCFFMSCEQIADFKDLSLILASLRKYQLILLDEISFVTDWARSIKTEIERLHAPSFIITGSNTTDLRKGGERLPGRFGQGGEFELLPMSFTEFSDMKRQSGFTQTDKKELLLSYFRIGGFPLSMCEAGECNVEPLNAQNTYWQWLVGDITRAGKNEVYLRDILGQLALTHGSQISLQTLAKKTQVGSHNTISDYIQLLEDCFALRTVYAIDPNSGSRRYRADKKYYFRDPLIYWLALRESSYGRPGNFLAQLSELVAAEHLGRRFPGIGYYKSKKGEVDFYRHNRWALEVKWKEVATDISKAFFEVPVAQRIVWTIDNFLEDYPIGD